MRCGCARCPVHPWVCWCERKPLIQTCKHVNTRAACVCVCVLTHVPRQADAGLPALCPPLARIRSAEYQRASLGSAQQPSETGQAAGTCGDQRPRIHPPMTPSTPHTLLICIGAVIKVPLHSGGKSSAATNSSASLTCAPGEPGDPEKQLQMLQR